MVSQKCSVTVSDRVSGTWYVTGEMEDECAEVESISGAEALDRHNSSLPVIVDLTADGTMPEQTKARAKKRRRSADLTPVDMRPTKLFKDAPKISSVAISTSAVPVALSTNIPHGCFWQLDFVRALV